jgi:orotate phosphoribosyltransferase
LWGAAFATHSQEPIVYDRQQLIDIVHRQALQFGDFQLASGARSSYYLDCRRVTLHSEGAAVIAAGILEFLGEDLPDAVGGMAIGADPITGAVIAAAGMQGKLLLGFIVRKEAKQHGTGKQLEGPVEPGQSAVIVEDVVTTGGSSLRAIEHARAFGLQVRGVVGLVDRLQGGAEAFAQAGCSYHSLLTIRDLGIQD